MHEKNTIDAMTIINKDLLGLENINPSDTNNEKFIEDYQEVNAMISELINEVKNI